MAADSKIGRAVGSALVEIGIPLRPDGGLHIVVVEDYLDGGLGAINSRFQASGTPWMIAKLCGEEVWVGPVILSRETACWRCFENRLREHRWLESQIPPSAVESPLTLYSTENRTRAAAEFVVQEAARWLLGGRNALEGAVWSFSWATLRSQRHTVLRRPDCPECGTVKFAERPPAMTLSHIKVAWKPPDDIRAQTASEVLARIEPLTSPITGILRRFEKSDLALPTAMHAYGAVYCPPLPRLAQRIENAIFQPSVCSGMGWSNDDAKAACVAEAVERYSTRFHGDERIVADSYRRIGFAAVHPNEVLLFSDLQFRSRDQWNREHSEGETVPEQLDESEEIEWLKGWSLTHNKHRLLPLALCLLDYRAPGKRWIGDADSSGCAAGSCIEEAILHAIFELVERDALGIWWYNEIPMPTLSPGVLRDSHTNNVCEQLAAEGWRTWIHDITTDFGIPTAVAIAENAAGEWVLGSAAHLNGATACRKAVMELWQLSRSRVRRGPRPKRRDATISKMTNSSLREGSIDLKELVEDCCNRVAGAGHELIAFDLTRPDLAFPTVRVVAPGLRHRKPRLGPGRLYQVPVRMGWRSQPSRESDLENMSV